MKDFCDLADTLHSPPRAEGQSAPRARIIYSSRTGNTRAVAEHLAACFGLSAVNAKEELAARKAELAGARAVSCAGGAPSADGGGSAVGGAPSMMEGGGVTSVAGGSSLAEGVAEYAEGATGGGHAVRGDHAEMARSQSESGEPQRHTEDQHDSVRVDHSDGPVLELGAMPPQGDAAGTDADILLLGMWAWRGGPNPTMRTFMRGLRRRRVFLFGTMAAWPDSPHAQDCLDCARSLLAEGDNTLLGHFFCQGKLDPRLKGKGHHPLTPERQKRLQEAERHPDMGDFLRAESTARSVLGTLGVFAPSASEAQDSPLV